MSTETPREIPDLKGQLEAQIDDATLFAQCLVTVAIVAVLVLVAVGLALLS